VRALGGDILVESRPGEGTIFRIQFPYQAYIEQKRYAQNLH
jgi:signal transduction histidine kinase